MIFLHSDFFNRIFNRINKFWKGDTNIYFKQITFFEKRKRFCKNHTYFFLKNIFLFQLSFATFEQPYQTAFPSLYNLQQLVNQEFRD